MFAIVPDMETPDTTIKESLQLHYEEISSIIDILSDTVPTSHEDFQKRIDAIGISIDTKIWFISRLMLNEQGLGNESHFEYEAYVKQQIIYFLETMAEFEIISQVPRKYIESRDDLSEEQIKGILETIEKFEKIFVPFKDIFKSLEGIVGLDAFFKDLCKKGAPTFLYIDLINQFKIDFQDIIQEFEERNIIFFDPLLSDTAKLIDKIENITQEITQDWEQYNLRVNIFRRARTLVLENIEIIVPSKKELMKKLNPALVQILHWSVSRDIDIHNMSTDEISRLVIDTKKQWKKKEDNIPKFKEGLEIEIRSAPTDDGSSTSYIKALEKYLQ